VVSAASGHFAAFERFERWALRSVTSDLRMRGLHALRETLFAPLRRARSVAWAEVQWDGGQSLQYRTPLADSALSFVPIEAEALGRVLVAVCEPCKQAGQTSDCVVIARPKEQRSTRVRMAFCKPVEEPQASVPKRKPRAK
jgi:hypothetical protein